MAKGGSHSGARGQILVETAIILPIAIFTILGALQLMLMQHGRVMTEYAAYAAARAGIVHDANWNVMRNAAMVATLPLYARTDTLGNFGVAWAKVKAASEMTEAIDTGVATLERLAESLLGARASVSGLTQDVSLVEIEVTSPDQDSFARAKAWQEAQQTAALAVDPGAPLAYPEAGKEIDFDDAAMIAAHPGITRLGVNVRVLYPLNIPIVNKIIFELWLAQVLLGARRVSSDLPEWARLRGKLDDGQYLDEAAWNAEGEGPTDDFFTTSQWVKEVRTLRWFAEQTGIYLVPLRASYAMPMQSNMFEDNRREPVWFSLE